MGAYMEAEVARCESYVEACDADIADLQERIKAIRKQKREAEKKARKLRYQMDYDKYVGCLTCFPFRDYQAAAELKGRHTCGLDAARRLEIQKKERF